MGIYIILLIIAIISSCIFIGTICAGDLHDDSIIAITLVFGLVAMASWSGFFYGVGVKHGSYETAKGHYKTLYLYDKDGNVTDTIAEFPR